MADDLAGMQKDFNDELTDYYDGKSMPDDLAGLEDDIRDRLRRQYQAKQPELPPGPKGSLAAQIRWACRSMHRNLQGFSFKVGDQHILAYLRSGYRDREYGLDAFNVAYRVFQTTDRFRVEMNLKEVRQVTQRFLTYVASPSKTLKEWWTKWRLRRKKWQREALAWNLASTYAQEYGREVLFMEYNSFRVFDESVPKALVPAPDHPYR